MGMIYKRKTNKNGNIKEGKFYWIKYYRNGKPYRESTGCVKESDAKRLLNKREGEISEGKLPGIYFDRVKFDELAEDFLRDRRINGKGVAEAEKRFKHLKPVFEGVRVTNITTPGINAYIEQRLDQGAANGTINRELAALRAMLNMGARQTPPKVNRVPYIPMLKENNVRQGFFEDVAFEIFRNALPSYLQGFVTFGYLTGWRKEEISGLIWDRVDMDSRTVRLNPGETKNKEGRNMYMEDELVLVMMKQETNKHKDCPYVFHRDGQRIKDIRFTWDCVCRETGLGYGYKLNRKYVEKWEKKGFEEGPIFHDFRRTAVRNMDRAGIPRTVAMMRTGHKTESTYNRYNIGNDADLKMAAQKLEKYRTEQNDHRTRDNFEPSEMQKAILSLFLLMGTNWAQPAKKHQKKRLPENG